MTPDGVCSAYADTKVKVRTADLDGQTWLIEGDRHSLEFLGNLLLAVAGAEYCGFSLGPRQAGSHFFKKKAGKGIYIHRLPCDRTHGADG
ncbi:MAG: hypothetical protein ACRDKW_04225 [Actinomycetota bacterium]